MRILVSIDGDGHFHAAHPADRKGVMNLIKKNLDGDYYYDIINDNQIVIKSDLSEYCCKDWKALIDEFIGRGRLEYVNISSEVPKECVCSKVKFSKKSI